MITRLFVASLLAIATLSGCSSVPQPTLSLSPTTVSVVRGSTVTATVTLSASTSESLTLAVVGLPPGVTVSFDPPVIGAGVPRSQLTITAEAFAEEKRNSVSVTASGSVSKLAVDLEVHVEGATLAGKVVSFYGTPVKGAVVSTQGNIALSAEDGSFQLTGISLPYDLLVVSPGTGANHNLLTHGLITLTPEIVVFGPPVSSFTGGSIRVTLPQPLEAQERATACVAAVLPTCVTMVAGQQSTEVETYWLTDEPIDAPIFVLRYEADADGYPLAYHDFAEQKVRVLPGDVTRLDVDLQPVVGTFRASINVVAPVGFEASGLLLSAQSVSGFNLPFASIRQRTSRFDVLLPDLGANAFSYLVLGNAPVGSTTPGTLIAWEFAAKPGVSTVVLRQVPDLITPESGATDVAHDVEFVFKAAPLSTRILTLMSSTSNRALRIVTSSDTVRLPDLSEFGYELDPSEDYAWGVMADYTQPNLNAVHGRGLASYADAVTTLQFGGYSPSVKTGALSEAGMRVFTPR